MHEVAVLALDAVVPLDLAIPAQVFGTYEETPYRVTVCAATPSVPTMAGFAITAQAGLEALAHADTVIVPGFSPHLRVPDEPVLEALRGAPGRIVSICTGAFALAAAGLLDGRRATTHWRDAADLIARHPHVSVEPDVLYVDEGDVLTSAGVASGLDLCLHILRTDHGADLAARVARRIVVPPHREGGQAQYVQQPLPKHPGGSLAPTRAWALQHLERPLTVRELAAHAHVSERTFARRFQAETGVSPLRWLLSARVDAARTLLETTAASVDDIADRCGFGTAANLRKHFHRHLSTTPTAYRRTFSRARAA
ncbi:helix-turn-helix domain-containing protein [Solirubrobacter sp. CPCC 204708]|uniref:Helix-turn-helix domain-containing protein n=1 Tax=Solirubrobacter deserti TaxID=2282478 RepID=A0ABT4RRZ3_9ACTN|nr:helix-turn-helix domain-containing protein [Solirubrobacter deserti]MBE2315115.1 helix-turn-helix domain-containing protein [Solirubrobacter deserti]MDA0141363.1 helix-turn-helix domain-containing protein [Solirubrobacter deserti]